MDQYNGPEDVVRRSRPEVPVTCFRPAALQSAAHWFLHNFPGHVLYAVKANPDPFVLAGLFEAGIRHYDAASLTEIQMVHDMCPGAHIAFMHPVKSRHAIERAYVDYGVRDFSFDSMAELEKIVAATAGADRHSDSGAGRHSDPDTPPDLNLLLRLAVPNTTAELPLTGKFGCPPEEAPALLKAARKASKRLGICFHVGSQTMDPQAYITALAVVGDILRGMPRLKVDIIDIGGGFPSAYPDMTPPQLADFKAAIDQGLAQLPHADTYEFWCEPGRALVAECTSVLVKVELRKGDVLYINDGTYGSLFDAGHIGFRYPVRLIRPTPDSVPYAAAKPRAKGRKAVLKPFRFYGPTCDSIDYMPGPFFLPDDIGEGDYIEIGQLGAYGNAMRTGFNGFATHEIVTVKTPPLLSMYDDARETTDVTAFRAA